MTTASQAIQTARRRVSDILPFGDQYQVQTYDVERRAWWQNHPTNYFAARRMRTEALIEEAFVVLGYERLCAMHMASQYSGGDWRAYVRHGAKSPTPTTTQEPTP